MIEPLIALIVTLLIALYRIRHRLTEDPDRTADDALRHGIEQLNSYYKKREK